MILTDWLTVVGICALGAVSPGPSLAIIIKHTLAGGRSGGTVAALTHGAGVGLYAFVCISGLAFVITTSPFWFTSLQWVGAVYLLWLGTKGIISKAPVDSATPPSQDDLTGNDLTGDNLTGDDLTGDDLISGQTRAGSTRQYRLSQSGTVLKPGKLLNQDRAIKQYRSILKLAARDGFMIVFLNPKIAVFFIALFSQFIGPDTSPLARTIYVITALVIDAGWYLLVAWLFSIPIWLAKLRRYELWFERLFGLILISIAGKLAFDLL